MTPRRTTIILASLTVAALAAGGAAARLTLGDAQRPELAAPQLAASSAPVEAEAAPETAAPAPVAEMPLRLESFGALAYNVPFSAPYPPVLAAAPPAETAPAGESALALAPSENAAAFPLPPRRPAELAILDQIAPLPPRRPAGLEAETTPAAPVQVAALTPQAAAAVAPETKPQLAEPPPVSDNVPDSPFQKGNPVYVRIFKQEGQLELWMKRGAAWSLYKTYAICKWSGKLGPKLREGDYQSPEGFYSVSSKQLRPNSNYYRAFNVGFPNAYDKQNGYTGGLIMVHGDCKSVGCFAMTNAGIDEIYNFVAAALGRGQKEVPVHIFPFRMTDTALARETGGGWLAFAGGGYTQHAPFWRNLKEGYDLFERTREPPVAYACNGRYAFNAGGSCARIAGW